jgi:hypothetical protein
MLEESFLHAGHVPGNETDWITFRLRLPGQILAGKPFKRPVKPTPVINISGPTDAFIFGPKNMGCQSEDFKLSRIGGIPVARWPR